MEFGSSENTQAIQKVRTLRMNDVRTPGDTFGEVNTEVTRGGGFGATDDLGSVLPVAGDFADFEEHLRKARAYEDIQEVGKVDTKENAFEAVNMEASVTSDEVKRAGGFGAKDDISSFLPVASDFTDFEANLRDAREYEDLNEEIHRPGLGWTSESK